MYKGRRVGTFTAGIVLVLFGALFLLRLVTDSINSMFIASLWPLILVFLGVEVITACIINKEEKMQYDFGAIILIIILAFFAMGMGGAEFVYSHMKFN